MTNTKDTIIEKLYQEYMKKLKERFFEEEMPPLTMTKDLPSEHFIPGVVKK